MNYSDKLTDGRWQKRRLQIMDRDGYVCQDCGKSTFLNIHHLRYTGNPWDAPDDDLITLCHPCHEKRHKTITTPSLEQVEDNIETTKAKLLNPDLSESARNSLQMALNIFEETKSGLNG